MAKRTRRQVLANIPPSDSLPTEPFRDNIQIDHVLEFQMVLIGKGVKIGYVFAKDCPTKSAILHFREEVRYMALLRDAQAEEYGGVIRSYR